MQHLPLNKSYLRNLLKDKTQLLQVKNSKHVMTSYRGFYRRAIRQHITNRNYIDKTSPNRHILSHARAPTVHFIRSPKQELQTPGRDTAEEGSAPLPPRPPLLRAPLAPISGTQLNRPRAAGPRQEPTTPPHGRPETVPTRPRPGCPAGKSAG